MYIRCIKLWNFRSWNHLELKLEPGVTIICAPNGYGKTNILEAIFYSSTLESHRVSTDRFLIKEGKDQSIISTIIVNGDREIELGIEISTVKTNRFQLNRSPIKNSRDIYGALKTVLFSPEDLMLIRGDPSVRRKYLDELVSIRRPRMASIKTDYERVIRQKNALLKSISSRRHLSDLELSSLDVWDQQLVDYGSELILSRIELINLLTPYIENAYQVISSDDRQIKSIYDSNSLQLRISNDNTLDINSIKDILLKNIKRQRENEIRRGVCLVGPHRDELQLYLGKNLIKGFASHGEYWSMALSLKLASYYLLKSEGPEPVLLLDDVFAELDRKRANSLIKEIAHAEQIIITEAVLDRIHTSWANKIIYIDLITTDNDRYSSISDKYHG